MIIQMDIKRARNGSTQKESEEKEFTDFYEAVQRLNSSQRAIVRREMIRLINQREKSSTTTKSRTAKILTFDHGQ